MRNWSNTAERSPWRYRSKPDRLAPFATPLCSDVRENQGRSGRAPTTPTARALCRSAKIYGAHDSPLKINLNIGATFKATHSALTSSHPLCCSASGSSPTATQDRFAPGSSVELLEFGAFSSAELHSRFVLDLIVVADDHCCLCQAIAVIRLGDSIQPRSPPGKHWAPFVRGCVPACSDPGHDKGRLANHDAVKPSFARSLSTAQDRQRWLFSSSPGDPSGSLFIFFIPVTATEFRR